MPSARPPIPQKLLRQAGAALLAIALAPAAQAQDAYFSQQFATRLHTNPAYAGLLDDYSATFSYRNQYPSLTGSFQTLQVGADFRLNQPGQHHAVGLLINQDQMGSLGYSRLEAGALYAYHTRLSKRRALAGGLRASYGRQQVKSNSFVFGDQFNADGNLIGPSAENADFPAVSYFSIGTGVVLYSERGFVSLSGQHLNVPNLGFGTSTARLPLLLSLSGGYKFFAVKPGQGLATREISYTPVGSYTRQGGSQRYEAGLYLTSSPITVGAVYRNIYLPFGVETQQVLAMVVGINTGGVRLGYSYDAALNAFSSHLGGAHEVTLALGSFNKLENAHRRIKRRDYPVTPCPMF